MELGGDALILATTGGVLYEEKTRCYSCDAGDEENVKDRQRKCALFCWFFTDLSTAPGARRRDWSASTDSPPQSVAAAAPPARTRLAHGRRQPRFRSAKPGHCALYCTTTLTFAGVAAPLPLQLGV